MNSKRDALLALRAAHESGRVYTEYFGRYGLRRFTYKFFRKHPYQLVSSFTYLSTYNGKRKRNGKLLSNKRNQNCGTSFSNTSMRTDVPADPENFLREITFRLNIIIKYYKIFILVLYKTAIIIAFRK